MHMKGIILWLVILLLSSCSSLSTWVRSNVEGLPEWVYEPQVGRSQMAYVGHGSANTEARAKALSYESILAQLGAYIGEDITSQHYKELSTRGTIGEYELKVAQEFVKKDEGQSIVYLLAVANRSSLEKERTAAEKAALEKQKLIAGLTESAAIAFRQNRDIEAASLYLDAAITAASMPRDRGFTLYTTNLNRVQKILDDLSLTLSKENPQTPSVLVTLRRGTRPLSPKIVQAPIIATFSARNGLGLDYTDNEVFITDNSGQFTCIPNNPGIVGSGLISFTPDMGGALEKLRVVDTEKADGFQAVLDSKRMYFPYSRVSVKGESGIVAAIMEYSIQGALLPTSDATDAMLREYAVDGLKIVPCLDLANEDDEDFLLAVKKVYPLTQFLIMGKAGISYSTIAAGEPTITVTGEVSLLDLKTDKALYRTGEVLSSASAENRDDAIRLAFSRFGLIASSLLDIHLYR